jgi:hypothetical protein
MGTCMPACYIRQLGIMRQVLPAPFWNGPVVMCRLLQQTANMVWVPLARMYHGGSRTALYRVTFWLLLTR